MVSWWLQMVAVAVAAVSVAAIIWGAWWWLHPEPGAHAVNAAMDAGYRLSPVTYGSMIRAEEQAIRGPDWREQTAHDLAPVTLDQLPPLEIAHEPVYLKGPEPIQSDSIAGQGPEPEPVWTVAGRVVESSEEWLRRLVTDASPGWTYAGTVAA